MGESLCRQVEAALIALGVTKLSPLLVAISGGGDSVALLSLLITLRKFGWVNEIKLAHVNHMLRDEESGRDERLVQELAHGFDLRLYIRRTETLSAAGLAGDGIEERARNERYEFFQEVARDFNIPFILTAHTKDDNLETIMLNIMRGAGLRGSAGIPVSRKLDYGTVLRPLLEVTRQELRTYLQGKEVQYANDSSNDGYDYKRNRIRNLLLPSLAPAVREKLELTLLQFASQAKAGVELVHGVVEESSTSIEVDPPVRSSNVRGLSLNLLLSNNSLVIYEILRRELRMLLPSYDLKQQMFLNILKFLNSQEGKFSVSQEIIIERISSNIFLQHRASMTEGLLEIGQSFPTVCGEVSLLEGRHDGGRNHLFDLSKLSLPLRIRSAKRGEKFAAFGAEGQVLLREVFRSARLLSTQRDCYPVVCDANGEVISIPNLRRSRWALVSGDATHVVTIQMLTLQGHSLIK